MCLVLCLRLWAALFSPVLVPAAPPAWAIPASIYEINPEMYSRAGDLAAVTADLPRLKRLGAGILWLTPIYPRGELKTFNSPYCVRDYNAVYPPYGTKADLRALVARAHRLGLHVILDWVGNHSSWDNPLIKAHPRWYLHHPDGGFASPAPYTDIVQFDYRDRALRAWMIKALCRWVRGCGVDGFRCDMAWKMPIGFWVQARAALEAIKPVFLLAESNSPEDQEAFDADYDWNLLPPVPNSDMIRLARQQLPATVVDADLAKEGAFAHPPAFFRLRFTSNHDEWDDVGSPAELYGGDATALAVLCATLPGKPLVYNGQDWGWEGRYRGPRTGWNQPPEAPIDWKPSARSDRYQDLYGRLFRLYRDVPAVHAGAYRRLPTGQDCRLEAYLRWDHRDKVLVLLNLGAGSAQARLRDPALAGAWQDLFSARRLTLAASCRFTLRPGGYRVELAGPACRRLMRGLAARPALAAGWPPGPYPAGPCQPCPTPVAYPTVDPSPALAPAARLPTMGPWQAVTRLVTGFNSDAVAADFRLGWDPRALALQVRVKDPSLHSHLAAPWEDDAVELYLDKDGGHAAADGPPAFQYIFSWDVPEAFERSGRLSGVVFRTTAADGGWRLAARVPWTTLGLAPRAGWRLGFDVGVDFNQDGSGRQGQLMWHGSDDNYKDPRGFGTLELAPR